MSDQEERVSYASLDDEGKLEYARKTYNLDEQEKVLIRLIDNEQHVKLVTLYAEGKNNTEASIGAGYKGKGSSANANRILKIPKVAELLQVKREMTAIETGTGRVSLVRWQLRLAKQSEEVGDRATARACIAEVAKLVGANAPTESKVEHSADESFNVNTNYMSNADYAAIIKEKRDTTH